MNQQTIDWRTWREEVIRELGVTRDFAIETERQRRFDFLSNYLVSQRLLTFVLGISGSVDSSTAGRLSQVSVERHEKIVRCNIRARQRMIAHYSIAGARAGVVIGTDHHAESLLHQVWRWRWRRRCPAAVGAEQAPRASFGAFDGRRGPPRNEILHGRPAR